MNVQQENTCKFYSVFLSFHQIFWFSTFHHCQYQSPMYRYVRRNAIWPFRMDNTNISCDADGVYKYTHLADTDKSLEIAIFWFKSISYVNGKRIVKKKANRMQSLCDCQRHKLPLQMGSNKRRYRIKCRTCWHISNEKQATTSRSNAWFD